MTFGDNFPNIRVKELPVAHTYEADIEGGPRVKVMYDPDRHRHPMVMQVNVGPTGTRLLGEAFYSGDRCVAESNYVPLNAAVEKVGRERREGRLKGKRRDDAAKRVEAAQAALREAQRELDALGLSV